MPRGRRIVSGLSTREQIAAALAAAERCIDLELVLDPGEAPPTELVALTALERLRLVSAAPVSLPSWFSRLRGLSSLELDAPASAIPDTLDALDTLEHLRLRLRGGFAPVLARMPALRELELELDELGEVPLELAQREALASVTIRARTLARVPLGLLVAPALRSLTLELDAAPAAPAMPRIIPGLRALEQLAIRGWPLHEMPQAFASLTSLRSLTLRRCALRSLPPRWTGLTALRHLDVSDNALEQLPASLAELDALETLVAAHNPLRAVDDAVLRLASLARLDLDGTHVDGYARGPSR